MVKKWFITLCALTFPALSVPAGAQESSLVLRPEAEPLPAIEKTTPAAGGLLNSEDLVRGAVKLSTPIQTVEGASLDPAGEDRSSKMRSSVSISTDFLDRLHLNPLSNYGPVLRSKLDMDLESGGVGLQTVEMGFEDRKLWLIHTPSTDDTEGSMGLELKLRW